jgi:SAM-dependent methyltransferase
MFQETFHGDQISREEPCRICHEPTGKLVGTVDYWDIKTSRLVQCNKCGHVQLDPMLTDEETSKGCHAYFIEEALRTSKEEQFKNCERNFRRGVVFGYSLKRKRITPKSVLELGPGTGYFSAGLQFVFPGIRIMVMDVNPDVLKFNRDHHNYETLIGIPDHFADSFRGRFDLVIARDILEHVSDISKVIQNIHEYLRPGGYLHFITPNGKEDVWGHYLTMKMEQAPSELLINHVNYFDGDGLKALLIQTGFIPSLYYTYTIKTFLRGKGWKEDRALMNPLSIKKSADLYILGKAKELPEIEFRKKEILGKWYIRERIQWITRLYCLYHHFFLFRINPSRNIGHEIYGLFRKA